MKTSRFLIVFAGLLLATPAFSVSKEIIQLQTQVQALQDRVLFPVQLAYESLSGG